VPTSSWPSGATPDDALSARIGRWAGFKAPHGGYWTDLRDDARIAELNARGLVRIMARHRGA